MPRVALLPRHDGHNVETFCWLEVCAFNRKAGNCHPLAQELVQILLEDTIEQFGVTANPTAEWVVQQIRNATSFGKQPKYLLHDNDSIFMAERLQRFLSNANIQSVRTAYHSPWQNGICERTIGIVRREVLDQIIPVNEKHLSRILREYIYKYYNPQRTHQGIGCQTPDGMPPMPETTVAGTSLISTELLGGLYHTYTKAA